MAKRKSAAELYARLRAKNDAETASIGRAIDAAAKAVPTVADYFRQRLGAELEPDRSRPDSVASPYHPGFTIETGCGVDCRAAIDAAGEILAHVANAFGPLPGDARAHPKSHQLRASIVDAARNVVLCYVYG